MISRQLPAQLTQPMALETGDRAWPFTWGMLLTPMRKAGGLRIKILCPSLATNALQATEHGYDYGNVGACARRSTGQPTPKKRPRDETQALSCNSWRDSGMTLQHSCGNPTLS